MSTNVSSHDDWPCCASITLCCVMLRNDPGFKCIHRQDICKSDTPFSEISVGGRMILKQKLKKMGRAKK